MESQHMTQQTFADFIGISTASLSSIFNGRTKPTLNTVEAIRSKFTTISLDWLMYGNGSMFKDQKSVGEGDEQIRGVANEGALDFTEGRQINSPLPSRHSEVPLGYGVQDPSSNSVCTNTKYIDKPQRRITEIRIFFDDQTWETFVPKK